MGRKQREPGQETKSKIMKGLRRLEQRDSQVGTASATVQWPCSFQPNGCRPARQIPPKAIGETARQLNLFDEP
jgi:hypothetical protein